MDNKPIIILLVGGGQDSVAILLKYIFDLEFRNRFFQDKKLVCVMSDTGNEFDPTYQYVNEILKPLCVVQGIEFYFLTKYDGYHSESWQTLQFQFEKNSTVMSVCFPKTCTDNLKIKPVDRFLQSYIINRYKFECVGKKAFYEYNRHFGKLTFIIGFAKGEESRMQVDSATELFPEFVRDIRPKWKQRNIKTIYPLISIGYNRRDCQDYIRSVGYPVPMPSNCKFCPFQNEAELVYLYRKYPNDWNTWVLLELKKLEKTANSSKRNMGVKGEKDLTHTINELNIKYAHWTTDQLEEYRFSHGHCVKSKY